MSLTLLLIVAGVLVASLVVVLSRTWGVREDWLPPELASARLVLVEKDRYLERPFRLAGRPDRVYLQRSGGLTPLEFKNRERFVTYPTDVAELSLQAWLLRRQGKQTSAHGYVTVRQRSTGAHRCLRVALMTDAQCEALIRRYRDVITGRVEPQACPPRRCGSCRHDCYPRWSGEEGRRG